MRTSPWAHNILYTDPTPTAVMCRCKVIGENGPETRVTAAAAAVVNVIMPPRSCPVICDRRLSKWQEQRSSTLE